MANQPAPRHPVTRASDKQGDLLSRDRPDLVVSGLHLTADGNVQYEITNRSFKSSNTPFVVDLYIGTARRDTVKHRGIAARASQTVVSELARVEGCRAVSVRIAVDPQNVIRESIESNNERRVFLAVPLPDLAIASSTDGSLKIKPVKVKGEPRYRLRVTLVNQGNASMPRVKSSIVSGPYRNRAWGAPLTVNFIEPGPLRLSPGEEVSVVVGPKRLAREDWFASVDLNYENMIRECDKQNNRLEWHN